MVQPLLEQLVHHQPGVAGAFHRPLLDLPGVREQGGHPGDGERAVEGQVPAEAVLPRQLQHRGQPVDRLVIALDVHPLDLLPALVPPEICLGKEWHGW
jgi:hypothetical protein